MRCSKCGSPLADGSVFCENCGSRVQKGNKQSADNQNTVGYGVSKETYTKRYCTGCGVELTETGDFCPVCGKPRSSSGESVYTEKKKSMAVPIAICASAVVIIGLIGVIIAHVISDGIVISTFGNKNSDLSYTPAPTLAATATKKPSETAAHTPAPTQTTEAEGVIDLPTPSPAALHAVGRHGEFGEYTGVVEYPTYSTYIDSEFSFSCAYPSHFVWYKDTNADMRYTLKAPDDTATFKILASYNSTGKSVKTVSDDFKSAYPGNIDYENSGSDWCVIRTYRNGTYHYGYFKLTSGMIRGFEFHFNGNFYEIYDRYINDIYESLDFDLE